jgi:hypothetical protein
MILLPTNERTTIHDIWAVCELGDRVLLAQTLRPETLCLYY